MAIRLHNMIGETLLASVPRLNPQYAEFKLLAVDVGGIWVESQDYVEMILKKANMSGALKTPVIFLPFSSIDYITVLQDSPALSETSLGLKP
jgi:hypothetical protein